LAIELEKDLRKFDKETYKLHTEHKYFINHEESNKDAINYSTIVWDIIHGFENTINLNDNSIWFKL